MEELVEHRLVVVVVGSILEEDLVDSSRLVEEEDPVDSKPEVSFIVLLKPERMFLTRMI